MKHPRRLIVVDADLNKRLATEFVGRGRPARSLASFHLARSLDPIVLRRLHERIEESWVLLTGDDHMPFDHAETLAELGTTVATIDRRKPPEFGNDWDGYRREVAHRWAHAVAYQTPGTIRRLSLTQNRAWTVPRGW